MNYLLLGQEEYLKRQFLDKLKKSLQDTGGSDFEVFLAGQSEIKDILDSLNTFTFISKNRITVIEEIDNFTKEEKDALLLSLKAPLKSRTLVLKSSSRELSGFLKELSGFAKVVRCDKLKNGELSLWIKKQFAARGKTVSPELANLVKEASGNDLFFLENEIEKITTFMGGAPEEKTAAIEAVIGNADYITGYELINMVLEKNAGKAFSYLGKLLLKESPQKVLGLITWQFGTFARIKNLPKGFPPANIPSALKISPAFARMAQDIARGLDKTMLERYLEILLEADLFIKTGRMNERDALERVLAGLCG